MGIVNQILAILNEVSFGHFYFEMALLFRQSMLVNSILCNFEVLYGLSKAHVEIIESVDKYFMRKIFQSKISTPVESFFIETNVIPPRFVILGRRIMYYHSLLQKKDDELVKNIFLTQQKFSVKNDWIETLKNDLNQCQINLSESEISQMKKKKFKKLVNNKLKQLSDEYLFSLQQSHTKSRKIFISENIKHYLVSNELALEEKRTLFQLRTMCDVKTNFKHQYSHNMRCRLCDLQEESEAHLLNCHDILDKNLESELLNISLSDLWAPFSRQKKAAKIFNKIIKIRDFKFEQKKLTQENPTFVSSSYTV